MAHSVDAPRSAEIVIIGAGVVGLSIAFHLAERGAENIVVLDRGAIASGATAKGIGGIRQQFATEANIRLSLESTHFYEEFEARVGSPFLFRQNGYLFLISDECQFAAIVQSAALQASLGVATELFTPEEVKARYPMIDVSSVVGASFCATDGSGSPREAAYAFARRARDLGVTIVEDATVIGVNTVRSRITAVRTDKQWIATGTVINAAGPWAPWVGQIVGVALPMKAYPRQVFAVTPVAELSEDFPFTVDMETGIYIHRGAASILLGGGDRDRESSYIAALDWSRFASVIGAAARRVPALKEAGSISGWCGLRDMTPDEMPILGPITSVEGFWCAAGFSGHGFMHAPAVGRIMAEWLLTGKPTDVDVMAVTLDRFASNDLFMENLVF